MMEARDPKESIETYRCLLTKNIILTDDFYRNLVVHGVLSESLVNDVKQKPTKERVDKLLDLILTRTRTCQKKFADVLELTGHHFLSDCLREFETFEEQHIDVNLNDLAARLPSIQKSIKDASQKQKLEVYLREQIRKEVVKQTWKGDIYLKEQLIITRQKQIEQSWYFEEEAKIREKSLNDLQESYINLQNFTESLRRECKSLQKHIDDLSKKHLEELRTQISFNMANDKQLTRLNLKSSGSDDLLSNILETLRSTLGLEYHEKPNCDKYVNLKHNFSNLCSKYREIKELLERFREERQYLANQIAGTFITDNQEMRTHFLNYIMRNEMEMNQLKESLRKLENSCEEMKHQAIERNRHNSDEEPRLIRNLEMELEMSIQQIAEKDDMIMLMQKQVSDLNNRLTQLDQLLEENRKNERILKELIQEPKDFNNQINHKRPLAESPETTDSDSLSVKQSQNDKITTKGNSRNGGDKSYLLKKQSGKTAVYKMDDSNSTESYSAPDAKNSPLDYQSKLPEIPKSNLLKTGYSRRKAAIKSMAASRSLESGA